MLKSIVRKTCQLIISHLFTKPVKLEDVIFSFSDIEQHSSKQEGRELV